MLSSSPPNAKLWELTLINQVEPGSLVAVARDRRLALVDNGSIRHVDLTWVDEAALALVDRAIARKRELLLVYPVPAGQVATLLAAQILLRYFVTNGHRERVGLVTSDPTAAARLWRKLKVTMPGDRVGIDEVFPCWRASPDGRVPGRPTNAGVVIGRRADNWHVRATVVDHLAGPVSGGTGATEIHLVADPLDSIIMEHSAAGKAVWGWSNTSLAAWHAGIENARPGTVPFSVSHTRLATMAAGVQVRAQLCSHPRAALALVHLRDDLSVLSETAAQTPSRHVVTGLRLAWLYTSTLAAVPVRPSRYDEYAIGPPRAAPPSYWFAPEIRAWARTLDGDLRDYAEIVASDLEELRSALEEDNPILRAFAQAAASGGPLLGILKTRTAARALEAELGPDMGALRLTWLGALHRSAGGERAIVAGTPPRSAWHRIDSGLAPVVDVAVLGEREADLVVGGLKAVRAARLRWGSSTVRQHAWRLLLDEPPPQVPPDEEAAGDDAEEVHVLTGPPAVRIADPFSPLGELLADDRLLLSEIPRERAASLSDDGGWMGDTEVVCIVTEDGQLLAPPGREMDRLAVGERLESVAASMLCPGDRLVIGRREGRLRLVEALEERVREHPALWAAHLLVDEYRAALVETFRRRAWTIAVLHEYLRRKGSNIGYAAVASWLRPSDTLGPQKLVDIRLLGEVLDIPLLRRNSGHVRAALGRVRGFRRAAGRALARAAAAAMAAGDAELDELGLDIDDLREAVLVTRIVAVNPVPGRVPWSDVGRLRPVGNEPE